MKKYKLIYIAPFLFVLTFRYILNAQIFSQSGQDTLGFENQRQDSLKSRLINVDCNMKEEGSVQDSCLIDNDGFEMVDRFIRFGQRRWEQRSSVDIFIDTDGDGICDNRGLSVIRRREKRRGRR